MANSLDKFRKGVAQWSGNIGSAGISDAVVKTVPLASTSGLPTDTAVMITVNRVDTNGKKTGNYEGIVGVVSGSNLIDCIRGVEGTAQAWTGGTVVEVLHTASNINELIDGILAEHNQDGTHKDTVVITDKAQTLTNKTLTSPILGGTPVLDATSAIPFYSDSLSRQAIINGNFDVWQRGTSFTTSGVWTADRWYIFNPSNKFTVSRQSAADLPGSFYCSRIQRNSGETLTNSVYFYYGGLESQDGTKFRGKKVTLSFYARKGANYSAASNSLKVTVRTGTGTNESFTSGVYTTGAATLVNSQENTLTDSWQKFTVTTPDVIANNVTQISFFFHWEGSGTAGAADYAEITQVQLCAGDVALPFMPKSYEEELRACQRYYEIVFIGRKIPCTSGVVLDYSATFKVEKRAIGTASYSNMSSNVGENVSVEFSSVNGIVAGLIPNNTGTAVTIGYFKYSAEL